MKESQNASYEGNIKKIRRNAGNWLVKHPNLWVNPMSVRSILRALSGIIRIYPDFIVIGGQKCGTTALSKYMLEHPAIKPALWKEVNFFDKQFQRGLIWYRANFPTIFHKFFSKFILRENFLCGDSTPYYLFHPLAAKRISETLPKIKLIVLLRDPVVRAYSHYNMEVRLGFENLSFEDALKNENERLRGEKEKMIDDENFNSLEYQTHSYLSRGIYVEQLKNWMKYFSKDQLLILQTEEFEKEPSKIINLVFKFLNLPNYEIKNPKKENVGEYKKMTNDTKKFLIEYFKPYNQELYEFLGRDFHWEENY